MGKAVLVVLGALVAAIGAVWFFQGIGSLAGSPMTGVTFWAFAGALFVVAGLILVVVGVSKRRSKGTSASGG